MAIIHTEDNFFTQVEHFRAENNYENTDLAIGFVNAYIVEQEYGGPEEGGWWFDTYRPLSSIRVWKKSEADNAYYFLDNLLRYMYEDTPKRSSVASSGDLLITIENEYAKNKPDKRPHYE